MEKEIISMESYLEKIVEKSINKAFKSFGEQFLQAKNAPEKKPNAFLSTDEAVEYINDRGVQIAKSTLYKHTMDGTISFQRFGGKKLMFKSEDLDVWIKERLTGSDRYDIIKKTAESAGKK